MSINDNTARARALASSHGLQPRRGTSAGLRDEHEAQIKRYQTRNEELAREVEQLQQDLDEARKEETATKELLEQLDEKYDSLVKRLTSALALDGTAMLRELQDVVVEARGRTSVMGARDALIAFQRRWDQTGHEPLVVVPPELRDSKATATLDRGTAAGLHGQQIFRALTALAAYAVSVERSTHGGCKSFKDWCTAHPEHWPAHLIAMQESKSVERDPKLKEQRVFPIDEAVNLSSHNAVGQPGRAYMGAHVKLKQGKHAPRLYFYDDTGVNRRGNPRSGKVYVGYVGTHLDTARRN